MGGRHKIFEVSLEENC